MTAATHAAIREFFAYLVMLAMVALVGLITLLTRLRSGHHGPEKAEIAREVEGPDAVAMKRRHPRAQGADHPANLVGPAFPEHQSRASTPRR